MKASGIDAQRRNGKTSIFIYLSLFVENKQFAMETKHAVGQDSETRVLITALKTVTQHKHKHESN